MYLQIMNKQLDSFHWTLLTYTFKKTLQRSHIIDLIYGGGNPLSLKSCFRKACDNFGARGRAGSV